VRPPLSRTLSHRQGGEVRSARPLYLSERGWGKGFAIIGLVSLSACVTQNGPRTGTLPATPAPGITAASATVTVGARAYLGEVLAGAPGIVIGASGATQVPGGAVKVYRPGLGQSDGIEAKAAAVATCAQAGGTFNAAVLGRFVPRSGIDGDWVFDGACT
jgi:hypothetical protein